MSQPLGACAPPALSSTSPPFILLFTAFLVCFAEVVVVAWFSTSMRKAVRSSSALRFVSASLLFAAIVKIQPEDLVFSKLVARDLSADSRLVLSGLGAFVSAGFSSVPAFFPRDTFTADQTHGIGVFASVCLLWAVCVLSISLSRHGHGFGAPLFELLDVIFTTVPPDRLICIPLTRAELQYEGDPLPSDAYTVYYGTFVLRAVGAFLRAGALSALAYSAVETSC